MKSRIIYFCVGILIIAFLCLAVQQYKEYRRLQEEQARLQFLLYGSSWDCFGTAVHSLKKITEGEPDLQVEGCLNFGRCLPHLHYFILYFKHIGLDAAPLEILYDELTVWQEESIEQLSNGKELDVNQKEKAIHYLKVLQELGSRSDFVREEYGQEGLYYGLMSRDDLLLDYLEELIKAASDPGADQGHQM